MTREELQEYIDENIPIVNKNGLKVQEIEGQYVSICGNLTDHTNHQGTVFGGTMSTSLILAAWAMLHALCHDQGLKAAIVIYKQDVTFFHPGTKNFVARSIPVESEDWQIFLDKLQSKKRASISVESILVPEDEGIVLARMKAVFVVKTSLNQPET